MSSDFDSTSAGENFESGDSEFDEALTAELRSTFREELREILSEIPSALEALVDPSQQEEICADLGRAFHTVKGSAATVGLEDLQELALLLQDAFEGEDEEGPALPLRPPFFAQIRSAIEAVFDQADLGAPTAILDLAAEAAREGDDDAVPEILRKPDSAIAPTVQACSTEENPAAHATEQAGTMPTTTAAGMAETSDSVPVDCDADDIEAEILEAFALDADAALEASEKALLQLEENAGDPAPLRVLFRQFHTLKGAAAAVNLKQIAEQMHSGETLLEDILESNHRVDAEALLGLLLRLLDSVSGLIADAQGRRHNHRILDDVDAHIRALASASGEARAPTPPVATPPAPPLSAATQAVEASSGTASDSDGIVRVHTSRLDLLMSRVGELVVSRTQLEDGMVAIHELRDKLSADRLRLGETIEGFRGFEFQSSPAGGLQEVAPDGGSPQRLDEFTDLEFDKYDDFGVLTRTLVEVASDTSEIVEEVGRLLESMGDESRQISKVTSSLQRTVSGMRLVSLDSLFRRLSRATRDAARQSGKQAFLETRGGDVQLDRSLVEALSGPLLHLVRNSVAHGITTPGERERAGKTASGHIRIEALQRHGNVEIRVHDDGEGLDFAAIRRRGCERDLLRAGDESDPATLARLIFEPGFSTREKADAVSGRGVGMDVVATEVERLRGTIAIDSTEGAGTEVRIHVPLTSIIDQVLLLRAGQETLALAQGPVETVLNISSDDLREANDQVELRIDKQWIPALILHQLVGSPADQLARTAVIVRSGEIRLALLVQRIEAQREAVIRPLGTLFEKHPFISSATLTGDGEVVFALDASRLAAFASDPARIGAQITATPEAQEETTILWADDSISVRKLADHFLASAGLASDTAVDGYDALEKLKQGNYRVLVTDLEMPRMHGYELLHEIRADPMLVDLPVIVCSSRSSEKHRRRARQAGANGYLTKPFTQESVTQAIRALLE
jgi:chemosensory pili system protein ChpA (sensor histidine kinase/response regulator)